MILAEERLGIGTNELKFDNLFRFVKLHLKSIEKSGLAENRDNARRVTEAGVEREDHFTRDTETHMCKHGADVTSANSAVYVRVLRIEGQVEFGADLKGEQAIICAGVNERQKIDEAILIKKTDPYAGTQDIRAVFMGRTWGARLLVVKEFHCR